MSPIPVALSYFEGNFNCSNIRREMYVVLTTTCLYRNRKAYVACNFINRIETEGLLKVTVSKIVILSRKQCKTDTLPLIESNIAYRQRAISDDL